MGNWFSCSYEKGWNKGNACPPGFVTKESCGLFTNDITCELSAAPSSEAVPVSARYNIGGEKCTSDTTNPIDGGEVPPSAGSCASGDKEIAKRFSKCCSNFFGACDLTGYSELKTCAEGQGDLVFDVWSPDGCKSKAGGLSNNFQAQQWCKDANMKSGYCWIPYSMNVDMDCFPFDKGGAGQWSAVSGTATSKFGGETVILEGAGIPASEFQNAASSHHSVPLKTANIGAVSGVGFIGAAAVVGIFNRRRRLRVPKGEVPAKMEMAGKGGVIV